jgi:Subtilase family
MKNSKALILVALLLAVWSPLNPLQSLQPSPVLADDDDDDDGGGAVGGGGGGGSGQPVIKKKRLKKVLPARPRAVVRREAEASRPERARFELVASGLGEAEKTELLSRGYSVLSEQPLLSVPGAAIVRLRVPRGLTIATARAEVAAVAATARVDLNHYYRPQQAEPCEGAACAAFELVAWPVAQQPGCVTNPLIGIVDTRVNTGHEALRNQAVEAITLTSHDDSASGQQHGTAVAALLVGARNSKSPGLLPDAKLIAVDPYHRGDGSDDRTSIYDLVRAIDLLVSRKPDAINLSLSGPANDLLNDAVARAGRAGIPVIAAAGNSGPRAKPLYPSAYDGVIAVTALDSKLNVYRRAGQGEHIDFAAPGVAIWTASAGKGIRQSTGTSFAAPFVTAAVAIINATYEGTSADAITGKLALSARDLGQAGKDPTFGHGLIRMNNICAG